MMGFCKFITFLFGFFLALSPIFDTMFASFPSPLLISKSTIKIACPTSVNSLHTSRKLRGFIV